MAKGILGDRLYTHIFSHMCTHMHTHRTPPYYVYKMVGKHGVKILRKSVNCSVLIN